MIQKIRRLKLDEYKICILMIIIFVLQLVPLFFISKYNFPSADDFSWGAVVKSAWEEEHNIFACFYAALVQAFSKYLTWQGRYVANFFVSLQPASFGEEYCILSPIMMIWLLVLSTFFFCYVLWRKIFNASLCQTICMTIVWLSLDIQFLPSAVQGFFWYSGAVEYTFFYCLSIILYSFLILYYRSGNSKWQFLIICILSFLLGGGGYVSAILSFFVYLFFVGYLIYKHKPWKMIAIAYALFSIAFVISVFSPGNSARGGGDISGGLIGSAFFSVLFAIESFNEWFNLLTILFILLLFPIMWDTIEKTSYRFERPIIISFISLILFSVQFFPHAYAKRTIGPDRLLNVIYFSFVFLLIFNIFYWLGWLKQEINKNLLEKIISQNGIKHSVLSLSIICGSILACCVALKNDYPSSSFAAINSLVTGEAVQYHSENVERLEMLKDNSKKEIVLNAYTKKPMLLFWDDGVEDPEDWRNDAMEMFYKKDSIVIQ